MPTQETKMKEILKDLAAHAAPESILDVLAEIYDQRAAENENESEVIAASALAAGSYRIRKILPGSDVDPDFEDGDTIGTRVSRIVSKSEFDVRCLVDDLNLAELVDSVISNSAAEAFAKKLKERFSKRAS